MVFSVLGAAWFIVGVTQEWGVQVFAILAILLVAGDIFYLTVRAARLNQRALRHFGTVRNVGVGLIVVVLCGELLIVRNRITYAGHPEWVVPAMIFLTGLHFIPIAKLYKYFPHYVTGSLLMLGAVVYPFLSAAGPSCPSGCFGAGLCFWGSALYGLKRR